MKITWMSLWSRWARKGVVEEGEEEVVGVLVFGSVLFPTREEAKMKSQINKGAKNFHTVAEFHLYNSCLELCHSFDLPVIGVYFFRDWINYLNCEKLDFTLQEQIAVERLLTDRDARTPIATPREPWRWASHHYLSSLIILSWIVMLTLQLFNLRNQHLKLLVSVEELFDVEGQLSAAVSGPPCLGWKLIMMGLHRHDCSIVTWIH